VSIVLFRIDERLVHGQVVIGWGNHLKPKRYLVVDDELAASEWEQELYLLGLPEGTEALFLTVAETVGRFEELSGDEPATVLLTRDLATMARLARGGTLTEARVNIGGIHHSPGREQVLGYVYLDDDDREILRGLADSVEAVFAQDLPASPRVSATQLLG
jgi:PTS system mannose-specific IIB component/fructoselysine and glucoselysine-specific PTS system IIB component